jgi:acyl carrier protein
MLLPVRTPENSLGRCLVCAAEVVVESSYPAGDAPCPGCGALLWFVRTSQGLRLYDEETVPLEKRLRIAAALDRIYADFGAVRAGVPAGETIFRELGMDSLDVVEMVMELEQEFGITISDEEAEGMGCLGDLIDMLTRCSP